MILSTTLCAGFPLALTEISASGSSGVNSVNAGAAVKKAAQSVENQAQILTTQLSNRVNECVVCYLLFLNVCSSLFISFSRGNQLFCKKNQSRVTHPLQ